MDTSINLDNVIQKIIRNDYLLCKFSQVYLFGSIIDNCSPNDIDILLIYEDYTLDLIYKKNRLKDILESELEYDLDIVMLSLKEEKELNFLDNLLLKYIKIKGVL